MNTKELAQRLIPATVGVYVFHGNEQLSRGSGFVFDDKGSVFTAGHVINNGRAFTTAELRDPALKIIVKIKGRRPAEYFQALPALHIGGVFKENLMIDLTGLAPKVSFPTPTPFLITKIRRPEIGEPVMMAGFSDELYPPFVFPNRLDPSLNGFPAFVAARQGGYDVELGLLAIKHGIVSTSWGFSFRSGEVTIKGDVFFVDNAMHSGASGGPVIDEEGFAIGTITERAVTRLGCAPAPDLRVPSGATHAMTLQPLVAIEAVRNAEKSQHAE